MVRGNFIPLALAGLSLTALFKSERFGSVQQITKSSRFQKEKAGNWTCSGNINISPSLAFQPPSRPRSPPGTTSGPTWPGCPRSSSGGQSLSRRG
jgi:hypothetical protein